MGVCKRLWLTILASLMIFATLPAMSMTPQQQKKMLDQLDQLDQMEKLDHFDFTDLAAKAEACTRARNFDCAEQSISKASKSISSSQDKKTLQVLKRNLVAERKAAEEERLAEERRLAEARSRESQSSGIQLGKLAAMGAGALIGGVGHMSAEVQSKVVQGIIKDSMPGQDGISNFKGNMDSLNAEQRARNERAAAAQRERQAQAIADEAANNRRMMDPSIRSHQSNDQNTTNRFAQAQDNRAANSNAGSYTSKLAPLSYSSSTKYRCVEKTTGGSFPRRTEAAARAEALQYTKIVEGGMGNLKTISTEITSCKHEEGLGFTCHALTKYERDSSVPCGGRSGPSGGKSK